MSTLTLSSMSPVTMQAVNALRPVQTDGKSGSSLVNSKDFTRDLVQRSLPAFSLDPLTSSANQNAGMAQEATASLLAALTAPQAAVSSTPTLDATTQPTSPQAPSTAPTAAPPLTASEAVPTQDPTAESASLDFALQAALRFGAGVLGSAPPAPASVGSGPGLVRDASSVVRTGSLQAHTGSPGPEAFLHPKDTLDRLHKPYQADSTTPTKVGLDLLA
jgi:hypothetical protein